MRSIQEIGIHIYNCLFDTCHSIKQFFRNWCIFACPARRYESPVSVIPPDTNINQRRIHYHRADGRLQHTAYPSNDDIYRRFYNARARIDAEAELIYDGSNALITQSLILPANERRFFMIRKPNVRGFPHLQGIGDVCNLQYETRVLCFPPKHQNIWLQIIDKNEFGYLVVAQRMQDLRWFPERANLAFREQTSSSDSISPRQLQRHANTRGVRRIIDLQEIPNTLQVHSGHNTAVSGTIKSLYRRTDGETVIADTF
ncbi:hypothetical protein GCM10023116_06770 [Kistimonas scapharcae]|uniref:Uncharacterized protein n=1 Tax=Kistimonas scapharcae TaxID=1036133 RepID=A0ABP8UWX0_9GAMM